MNKTLFIQLFSNDSFLLYFSGNSMHISTFLLPTDPNLGRVDRQLLTDQTLMEVLFESFDD